MKNMIDTAPETPPMPEPLSSSSESSRAETRRAQILAAAADCFRSHGFHGASIAQISKAAGMSAGHIYHYFDNKEAIIAAIVAQDLERFLSLTAGFRAARNVQEAMIGCVASGVEEKLDPATAGLKLEIVAEAARNPRVAEIVRDADRACRESLAETLRAVREASGHHDDDATLQALTEVMAAMFEGLLSRSIRNPDLDRDRVVRVFQTAMRDLMNQTP